MTSLYVLVVYGTVREERKSIGIAHYVTEHLALRPGVETRLFDPRDLRFSNVVRCEWERTNPPPDVTSFVVEMGRADGFVIVTLEYKFGVPGPWKT